MTTTKATGGAARMLGPVAELIVDDKNLVVHLTPGEKVWGLHGDDRSLLQYMARTHVHYILQERFPVLELNADPNALLNGFVSRNAAALVPVFTNDWYVLYRLT